MSEVRRLVCSMCNETTSSFFIAVGDKIICNKCKDSKKSNRSPQMQKPRIFVRYICKTHECGTYNVNVMYNKHAIDSCVIVTQETLGIVNPATFGGFNGDISRKFFLGVNEMLRLKINLRNYGKFMYIHYRFRSTRLTYMDRKYYMKHLSFMKIKENPDFHKFDEVFKKLKFNVNTFIGSVAKRDYKPYLSKEERNKLYYSKLMKTFNMQLVKNG